jgi:ribosomal protein S18 acetylase RimI-like enzyme
MTSDLVIRRRRAADLPKLGSVLRRVHQLDGYPVEGVDDPEGWLQPAREIGAWTALLHDEPIGQVSLTDADTADDAVRVWINETSGSLADIAVVVRLFVHPGHRGHGAGRELMRAAFEHATMLGKRLVFDVMLKDQQAIRLYEALGCERLGVITHHHSEGLGEPAAVYVGPEQVPTRLS